MALDPIFANQKTVMQIVDDVCDPLLIPAFKRQTAWLFEEIEGLEADAQNCEERIAAIQAEIPRLERELLVKQRDLAEYRLAILEKKTKLAESEASR